MNRKYILGIDTSNYKTSIAVTDDNQSVICDLRRFLKVKQGEKGLRQSDALFQHVKNIPEMMDELRSRFDGEFHAVSYSSKPRPCEGSYMPVFLAGESFARSLAAALCIPVTDFSHQEGHIEAIRAFSRFKDENHFMACHFSGGTTELLDVTSNGCRYNIEIIGGSKDISFGQVIERAGVLLGMEFPAGEELDTAAVSADSASSGLTSIKVRNARINLSGIDTQLKRLLETENRIDTSMIIRELFEKISDAMAEMIIQGADISGVRKVIMAGGVSSSIFIRASLKDKLNEAGITAEFNDDGLSQDNAVGTALLGGKSIWR